MHLVISAFEDLPSAERAINRLVASGVPRHKIHLNVGGKADFGHGRDRGLLASLGHFFASMFGHDNPDREAAHFREAALRGHPVVVIDHASELDTDRVADLLDEMGAIDVRERAEAWKADGWNAPTDSPTPPTGQQMMVGPQRSGGARVWSREDQHADH